MTAESRQFDIIIVGAGAVGGILAYALARSGYRLGLVEKTAVSAEQQPAFDERHLGFSRSTKLALEALGLWQALSASAVDVTRIHVSSRGRFGSVMMDARDEGLDSLGYVLPAREIGKVLHQAIAGQDNIEMLAPASVVSADVTSRSASVELEYQGEVLQLEADLLVAADGAESHVRELFAIGNKRWEYDQSAVIANLDVDRLAPGLAFERFIDVGAIALLPRSDHGFAAVCSVHNDEADRLMAMDDAAFADYLQTMMGSRLAGIGKVGKRYRFPLALVRASEVVRERLVFVGNAAHFIHPVAAQGFNLSMRDVAALIDVLNEARASGQHPGELAVLRRYADWRQQDENIMVAFTDGLIRIFDNPLLPVALLRQNGLLALRYFPGLRRLFTRAVTGRLGRQAGLMRGIPLT